MNVGACGPLFIKLVVLPLEISPPVRLIPIFGDTYLNACLFVCSHSLNSSVSFLQRLPFLVGCPSSDIKALAEQLVEKTYSGPEANGTPLLLEPKPYTLGF